jgi:hypothetical protein
MIDSLQDLTEAAPPALQWLVIIAGGAIPFIESYFGSVLGIVAGVNPFVAIPAAILGNFASMALLVTFADKLRGQRKAPGEPSARRQKFKRAFDRYGVAGVSLLGQAILPSQITALAMVGFGADKRAVIFWQTISIILWGVAFGVLAVLGYEAFTG